MSHAANVSESVANLLLLAKAEIGKVLADGKATPKEIGQAVIAFVVGAGPDIAEIFRSFPLDDEGREKLVAEALDALYVALIEPIDLPGPDVVWDQLVRCVVLPAAARGIVQQVRKLQLKAA